MYATVSVKELEIRRSKDERDTIVCVYVCVCVRQRERVRERDRERGREIGRERERLISE